MAERILLDPIEAAIEGTIKAAIGVDKIVHAGIGGVGFAQIILRQEESKHAARARFAFHMDAAAQQARDFARDR